MKKKFIRISAAFLLLNVSFLIILILFPAVSYGHETHIDEVSIFHNEPLPAHFIETVKNSLEQVKKIEIYHEMPAIDLCLNDGSFYPGIIKKLMGDDVFRAFANKSVMMGELKSPDKMHVWGRDVDTGQFLSHALIHNLQFSHHGLWDANPLGRHAEWKWEGYVEYELMGRNHTLTQLNEKLRGVQGDYDWVELGNGKGTVKRHVIYLMLVKYCKEQEGLKYQALMDDERTEQELLRELMEFISTTNR